MSLSERFAGWTTAALLSVVFCGLLTAALAFLSPAMFRFAGTGSIDAGHLGFFYLTSVMGAWTVLAVTRWWAGERIDSSTRRITLLAGGCVVGVLAWSVGEWLMVRPVGEPFRHSTGALIESIGRRPLVDAIGFPTLLGYMLFFGGLFGLRRWWWHTDEYRPKAFRVSSVLLTILLAYVQSTILAFPPTWAVAWAAVISCVVQLSSAWAGPKRHLEA